MAERITDKMPTNFRFLGLIHLALPNARIIHACRDPRDTAISCLSIRSPMDSWNSPTIWPNSDATFVPIKR